MSPNTAIRSELEQHLLELRKRLLRTFCVITTLFIVLYCFSGDLYHLLAKPLLQHLPNGTGMIATGVIAPFLTPLKLTFILAVLLGVPWILAEVWGFIAPGLYQHEKRLAVPLLTSSILLFVCGMAFAYFLVFPLVFGFLHQLMPAGITYMPDMSDYLNFTVKILFAFGFAFQMPIAILVIVRTGLVSISQLKQARGYVIIAVFLVGMLLTPPDVVSQIMLAIPLWVLFELGVLIAPLCLPTMTRQDSPH